FKNGAGQGREAIAFQAGHVRVKANSVGSVVMGTAFMWAVVAGWLSPNMDKKGDTIKVYSLQTPEGQLETPVLSVKGRLLADQKNMTPEELKAKFYTAIEDDLLKVPGAVRLDGKAAVFDKASIREMGDKDRLMLYAEVKSGTKTAGVNYEPVVAN